jgi:hypothetical protein
LFVCVCSVFVLTCAYVEALRISDLRPRSPTDYVQEYSEYMASYSGIKQQGPESDNPTPTARKVELHHHSPILLRD